MSIDGPMAKTAIAWKILCYQIAVLLLCFSALLELAVNFPFPSPAIKPLLPPKLRWPTAEISAWVEEGQFDRDFARYFARDPERVIPSTAGLVAPADGIASFSVVGDVTYFVVNLSFWDVHVVRTPVAGTVKSVDMEGSYLARLPPAAKLREMQFLRGKAAPVETVVTIASTRGDVQVRMITSYWASRIKTWVYPGQKLDMGERIGRILLGSTVITEFPGKVAFGVKAGDHVSGGSTAISP